MATKNQGAEEEKATEAKAAASDTDTAAPGDVTYGFADGVTEVSPVEDAPVTVEGSGLNPLWQSGTASTDGNGPAVEDVSHVFHEARAVALNYAVKSYENDGEVPDNVVLPEDTTTPDNNDEALNQLKDSAKAANDSFNVATNQEDNSKDNKNNK